MIRPSVVWTTVALLLLPAWAAAQGVPSEVTYVGELTDNAGVPVANAELEMTFRMYPDEEGGAAVWTEVLPSVRVTDGRFVVQLGAETPLDAELLAGAERWLGVAVQGGPEMAPRLRVSSVPYAILAGDSERLGGHVSSEYVTHIELPPILQDFVTIEEADIYVEIADLAAYLRADGTTPLAGPWDLGGQPLSNIVLGDGAPAFETVGALWFDTAAEVLQVYLGEAAGWRPLGWGDGHDATLASLECGDWGVVVWEEGRWDCRPLSGSDTLAALGCAEGQIAKVTGGIWRCAADADTWLSPTQVTAIVNAAGFVQAADIPDLSDYLTAGDVAVVALSGSYGDLDDTPPPPDLTPYLRADGTVPLAGDLDIRGHELLNIVVHNAAGGAPPVNPNPGQLWWNTTERQLRLFDGLSWRDVGAAITVADLEALGFRPGAHTTSLPFTSITGTAVRAQIPLAGDADTVDGAHAAALEESQEILQAMAAHVAVASAHHTRPSEAQIDSWVENNGYVKADGSVAMTGDLDFARRQLLNPVVHSDTTAPQSPVAGQLWWDAGGGGLKVFTGAYWKALSHPAGGPGAVPVGGIVAWANSMTGTPALPAGWVACNGQVLDDVESPFHAREIPDLNGATGEPRRFLRGATASGVTGGADEVALTEAQMAAHDHMVPVIYQSSPFGSAVTADVVSVDGTDVGYSRTREAGGGLPHENRPAFYEVVWIMRVK